MSPATDDPTIDDTATDAAALVLGRFAVEELDARLARPGVVDRLLDLRNAASGSEHLVAAIDEALRRVPGRDVVPADWWRQQVLSLSELVEPGPADERQVS